MGSIVAATYKPTAIIIIIVVVVVVWFFRPKILSAIPLRTYVQFVSALKFQNLENSWFNELVFVIGVNRRSAFEIPEVGSLLLEKVLRDLGYLLVLGVSKLTVENLETRSPRVIWGELHRRTLVGQKVARCLAHAFALVFAGFEAFLAVNNDR